MLYDLDSCITTSVVGILRCFNTFTNDLFWPSMVMVFFFVLFITFRGKEVSNALTATSFITTVITMPLVVMGLVHEGILLFLLIGTLGSVVLSFRGRK